MSEETIQKGKKRLFSNKDLRRLIFPLILELLLTLLVGMIDSIMVSSVSESAVSGVSLIDTIMQLLIYIFAALGTGGAVVAGQYLGSGSHENACKSTEQLIWFSGIISIFITVFIICLKGVMLDYLFGQITPEVREYANTYLTITAFSIPAIALYEAGAATFRTMGNSKATMWISVMMNLINIVGNSILIYGAGMATGGAAISTFFSRFAAAAVVIVLLLNEQRELHIAKSFRLHLDWELVKKILYIGVPNGLENGMFQLGKILVLSLVSTFGTYAITANAIATNISAIQVIPGSAIALAITPVISRCIGKGDYEQVHYYNRLLILVTYGTLLVIDVLIFLALPLILPMYHLTEQTEQLTTQMLLCHTISAILIWPLTFDLPASMRAAGDVTFAMIVSIVSMWVFRIGAAYFLAQWLAPVAFLPFIVLMFGIGNIPAIVIIFIAGFFPILLSTVSAVENVDEVFLKVAKNYGLSRVETVFKVIFPAIFHQVANSVHLALGTAWIFLVSGEMVGTQSGLGFLIMDTKNCIRMDSLVAVIITIGVIGFILDEIIKSVEKLLIDRFGIYQPAKT